MGVIGGVSQAVEPTDAKLECQKLTFSIFHFWPLLLVSTKILYTSAYIYNCLAWGVELHELQQFETRLIYIWNMWLCKVMGKGQ